jgi:NAD-dependent dihydropyrimidine dehydrogenase PreA subunit
MAQEKKKTEFIVYKDRCIGCGICVDACPMKILAIENDICIMTDTSKCLECGTCIRECPQDAITIPGVKLSPEEKDVIGGKVQATFQAVPHEGGSKKFTPILQHLTDILLKEVKPVQVFEHDGVDVSSLHDFALEGEKCYYRVYKADKLEKVGISRMNFYGSMVADVLSITPGAAYDIPYYIMDWDESDDHIFFICDLMPSDDLARNPDHLQKYFFEPLDDFYQTYSVIPGMRPSVFHWVRAIHSPYIITGTIDKHAPQDVSQIYQCALDYFNVWLNLYKNAQPLDINSAPMKLIHERRKQIRALYRENDPGVGSLNKFLGDKLADASLSIIEP